MLYSKPKTERKAVVELVMDCQMLIWVIRCFYADPVLAFTLSHAPSFVHVIRQPLPFYSIWAAYAELLADDWSSGYSCARPVCSSVVTYFSTCLASVVLLYICEYIFYIDVQV